MSRYIDANALKAWFFRPYSNEESYCNMDVAKAIDNAPTVDAVPVVRCKECIHRPKMLDNHDDEFDLEFPDHKCPCQCEDGFYSWYPADDWFCADGERRTV